MINSTEETAELCTEEKFDRNDCQISFDLNDRIISYKKNNSITYALLKKIKYQYFNTEIKLRYNFFGYGGVDKLYKDFDYTNYEQAKKNSLFS